MTSIDELCAGIRALLRSHPTIKPLEVEGIHDPNTVYVERHVYAVDRGIGHEAHLTTKQNLWVHLHAVKLDALRDIEHEVKRGYGDGEKPGRNSNLEQIPGFRQQPLIRFSPKNLWDAARIISAAAGRGDCS